MKISSPKFKKLLIFLSSKKKTILKKILIFLEMELSSPQKPNNSLKRNWMLDQLYLFTGCSSIQFFNSPPFPNRVSQGTFGTLPLTMKYLCDLRDAIPRHWSPSTLSKYFQKLLTQKIHFQNSSINEYISKIFLKKLLPQKIHFENCSIKKYIFRIVHSQFLLQKNTFSKLLRQKIHLQNYSLIKPFFKLPSQKT